MGKKIGIVICTYNRPEYLEQCLESFSRVQLDTQHEYKIIIVDDCSTDEQTIKLIEEFGKKVEDRPEIKSSFVFIKKDKQQKIYDSVQSGYNLAFTEGCDIAMNIDSDAIFRYDFMFRTVEMVERFPDRIITGFNCRTRNTNGTERHAVITEHEDYNQKKSVGGIHMAMMAETFWKFVRPVLIDCIANGGNWDHKVCLAMGAEGLPIVSTVPSVVQHIGFDSAMNHHEEPDTAEDFKELHLKGVELVIVDCVDLPRAMKAVEKSCEHILYDKVTILSSIPSTDPRVTKIPGLHSKEAYSNFMIKELHKYITSEHILVIQYDGCVMNHKAWNHDWLKYDYIGATWWYNDGMNVGNGGFSLRSKKLQFIVAHNSLITKCHPEDEVICRTHRKHIEQYGIVYAPEDVAKNFSIEGYNQKDKQYKGQFGFHGTLVKFHEAQIESKEVIIINQFFGLGDILFCIPIARKYIALGHKVLWPVQAEYVNVNKHFPEITFVDKALLSIDYDKEAEVNGNGFTVIPMRFTHRMAKVDFKDCMRVKYEYYGHDMEDWRTLTWTADQKAEDSLFKQLGLKEGESYCLVNTFFRSTNTGQAKIKINPGMKIVEMKTVEGYTLLDWAKVIREANQIHTVSTSIIYMLEVMEVKAEKINIYLRKPDEQNHNNYSYLLKKHNYVLMP